MHSSMEAHLLSSNGKQQKQPEDEDEEGGGRVLYRASFEEKEKGVVGYESAQWVLLSLVLLLAWGVGLLMLLYLPFRRYAVRQDVRSRRLYVTSNAIVYKVAKPIFLPCFGVNRREKHILLSLVTDVAIEQGCLQSAYGVHSIKIENASRRKPPPGDDLQIVGVDNPRMFRKVVLMALSNLRRDQGSGRGNGGTKSTHVEHEDERATFLPERSPSQNWAWQQGTGLSSWQHSQVNVLQRNNSFSNLPRRGIHKPCLWLLYKHFNSLHGRRSYQIDYLNLAATSNRHQVATIHQIVTYLD